MRSRVSKLLFNQNLKPLNNFFIFFKILIFLSIKIYDLRNVELNKPLTTTSSSFSLFKIRICFSFFYLLKIVANYEFSFFSRFFLKKTTTNSFTFHLAFWPCPSESHDTDCGSRGDPQRTRADGSPAQSRSGAGGS